MTGQYQYTIAQQRIAELHREGERERLVKSLRLQRATIRRSTPIARLRGRFTAARVSTN
jgi:hypothetical protein